MTEWILKLFVKDYKNAERPSVRSAIGKTAGGVAIGVNVLLSLLKILAGAFLLGGSVSVIADGVNNLSDAASGLISLLGFKLAEKPADAEHPYGHGRYEYLSGLMVALLILVIGVELLKSSVVKIFSPGKIQLTCRTVIPQISCEIVPHHAACSFHPPEFFSCFLRIMIIFFCQRLT